MSYEFYCRILGVRLLADYDEITMAYRQLYVKFHPFQSQKPQTEAELIIVEKAYDWLVAHLQAVGEYRRHPVIEENYQWPKKHANDNNNEIIVTNSSGKGKSPMNTNEFTKSPF